MWSFQLHPKCPSCQNVSNVCGTFLMKVLLFLTISLFLWEELLCGVTACDTHASGCESRAHEAPHPTPGWVVYSQVTSDLLAAEELYIYIGQDKINYFCLGVLLLFYFCWLVALGKLLYVSNSYLTHQGSSNNILKFLLSDLRWYTKCRNPPPTSAFFLLLIPSCPVTRTYMKE